MCQKHVTTKFSKKLLEMLFNLYIYSLLIIYHSIQVKSISEFLSKNKTISWYKNVTYKEDPNNVYCSICCLLISKKVVSKSCGRHTLCLYRSDNPGPSCKGFLKIDMPPEEKDLILDAHNTIRALVANGREQEGNPGPQEKASNMRIIEWDQELEMLAYRWAAQCIFANDLCRDVRRFPVGQNIARGNYALNDDLFFIGKWYENVVLINRSIITSYRLAPNDVLSQYTQLLWADTYQIGCARVAFQQIKGPNVSYREHFVCNYGPTGNIPGYPVYKIGEPCSQCPEGTACTVEYPGLCGNEKIYEISFMKHNVTRNIPKHKSGSCKNNLMGFFIYFLITFIIIL